MSNILPSLGFEKKRDVIGVKKISGFLIMYISVEFNYGCYIAKKEFAVKFTNV